MDIEEIIKRKPTLPFTVREMEYVVEHYIYLRKGVQVQITIESTSYNEILEIYKMILHQQVLMLQVAFDTARRWMLSNR